MHQNLQEQYAPCTCEVCQKQRLNLEKGNRKIKIKSLLNTAEKAFKKLYEVQGYNPEDLTKITEYKGLINKTAELFSEQIPHHTPKEMRAYLKENIFIFSGLKTHAQLAEARSYLKDEKGHLRAYHDFEQKILKLNKNYNENYLQAEYEFAGQSAMSASNWANLQDDTERYWLEYRTAGDDRVRVSHQQLNGICLPKNDPFWNEFYPPNGWRCRCVATEVLAKDKTKSDSKKAIELGRKATTKIGKNGKNKLAMFRFNPGQQKKVFPPNNAYTKVVGASKAKEVVKEEINKFIPEKINKYEERLNIQINKEIFTFLKKDTPLTFSNPSFMPNSGGAYYLPSHDIVRIPIDERRKRSKWKAESVVYHEYGHAADWQNGLKKRKDVLNLMDKYRSKLDFRKIDDKLRDLGYSYYEKKEFDLMEQTGAAHDTLMSLNPNFGMGHSKEYWKKEGNKEAEFLAHAFENKFAGNEIFKKVMPELYEETIKLIDGFKPK